jgi:hypothetical protein
MDHDKPSLSSRRRDCLELAEIARRYAVRAEECRVISDAMVDPGTRKSMVSVAETYERMAEQLVRIAGENYK